MVALCSARLFKSSLSGTAVRPAFRVRITVWLTSGRVYSFFKDAAAARKELTPRRHIVPDAPLIQGVHLLPVCAVHGRISGVEADRRLSLRLRLLHHRQHLLQGHGGAVVDLGPRLCQGEELGIDQGSGVDDHIRLLQKAFSLHRDQLRVPRAGSYKMNHVSTLLSSRQIPAHSGSLWGSPCAPPCSLVAEFPTKTVVNMSVSVSFSAPRVTT